MQRSTVFQFLNNRSIISGEKIRLRPRRIDDAADEFRWRTDIELCLLDAATPLELTYADFLERYLIELEYPGLSHTMAVETMKGKHIGSCSIFNFDFLAGNVEVGLMIGEKEYWSRGYGSDALKTLVQYIFQVSDIRLILLRTLDWNRRAQVCFSKCGFSSCGTMSKDGYNFIVMELKRTGIDHSTT